MENKQFLSLDVGEKKVGLARASAVARIPEPLDSVDAKDVIAEIRKLIEKYKIDALIVGLPRNLNGEDTKQTQLVRDWVLKAKSEFSIPFYWQDEALTSKLAAATANSHTHPKDEHSLAAAVILDDFLSSPESERVIC